MSGDTRHHVTIDKGSMTPAGAKPAAVWDPYAPDAAGDPFNNSGGPQFSKGPPPLEVDRPEHTFYRRILHPYFAKAQVEQLEGRIRAFVAEMLQPVIEAGGGDLAGQLTYPLLARTLCAWLGLPDSEWAYLKRISDQLFNAEEGRGNDPETVKRCAIALDEYSRHLVEERVERPGDPEVDLITGIIGKSDGERTVTAGDAVQLVRLLLVAGQTPPPARSATA